MDINASNAPGIEWEYETAKNLFDEIKLEEVSSRINDYVHLENMVVVVQQKEEEGEEKTCRETKLLRKAYSSLQWSFCSCKRHGILCLLKSLQVSMESLEISLKLVV